MTTTLNVAIFDGNTLFRQGLVQLFPADFHVVGQAASVDEGVALLRTGMRADIILLDVGQQSAGAAIRTVKEAAPDAKIVYLTDGVDTERLRAALEAGAEGYLTRNRTIEALAQALRLVAVGEKVFPSDLAALMTARPGNGAGATGPRGISVRETQILQYLLAGESNKAIARHLNITEATVKVHLKSLLRKISCANRTQAAIWGMNNGISATDPSLRAA
jgi:two-component system nitrate/nitrite response regulator NarL